MNFSQVNQNAGDVVNVGVIMLPRHACSLSIEHNQGRDYYQDVATYLKDHDDMGACPYVWKDDEAKARAIAMNEIWTMQWYPDTPIGFYSVAAPTLGELLAWALEYEAGWPAK